MPLPMRARVLRIVGVVCVALLLWFLIGALSAQRACAHDPRFACSPRSAGDSIRIADPEKSWAFYGRLAISQSDTYAFEVNHPIVVPISLLVERADAANPARPLLHVVSVDGKSLALIDFRKTVTFYEPFSGIHYLSTPQRELSLRSGAYIATVTMRGGSAPQRYVLAFGEAERFGIGEIPYVLGAIYRVKTRGY